MQAHEYPFVHTVEVTFRDLDVLGHVNHAVYFTYMETARWKYLRRLFEIQKPQELPVIVVQVSCTYRSPAFLGETLYVGVGISRFGNKSFDMVYRLEGADGRLVAEGLTVQVMYDYQAGRTFPVPEAFKARVAAWQKEWQLPDRM